MSVEYLEIGRPTRVGTGQIEVELVHSGDSDIEVDVVTPGTGESARFHRISPTSLVMGPVTSPLQVIARSQVGPRFPDGSSVQLVVRVGHGPERAELVLGSTDIGALSEPELLDLRSEGDFLRVEAIRVDDAAPADPFSEDGGQLEGFARECMYSARQLRQAAGLPSVAGGITVGLDSSASMLVHQRSGLIQLLLEATLGIDRGIGDGGVVPVISVGSRAVHLEPLGTQNIDSYVDSVLAVQPATSGCQLELLADQINDSARSGTVLFITDQIPGDAIAVSDRWRTFGGDWCLVVIGPEGQLRSGRNLSGTRSTAVDPGLTLESVSGSLGEPLRQRLIASLMGISDESGEQL